MILGLTGTNGSGKTAAADYLRRQGLSHFSLSDVIRQELLSRGETATRDNLTRVGNELRARFGASVLARRVAEQLTEGRDYVVDSIRNPNEVAELRRLAGFRLVYFEAPLQVRYERAVARNDERTPPSFEEFVEQEEREMQSDDETTQQLRATFELADETIVNDGALEDLTAELDRLLEG